MVQGSDRSDPDVLAMILYMPIILRDAIELAGAVRDLVYTELTEDRRIITMTTKIFERATDAAYSSPGNVSSCFSAALTAAKKMQDPAAPAITEVINSQVERSMFRLPHYGTSQAAATAFAATFPNKAADMAEGYSNLDHFRDLYKVFQTGRQRQSTDWPLEGAAKAVFERDATIAASHAAKAAIADCGNIFAMAAAAHVVIGERIPDYPIRFLEHDAQDICDEIYGEMMAAGAPQKWASEVTSEMLYGAREYTHDGPEATGETAVRAVRAAHHRVSKVAGRAAFYALYSVAAGGAWTAAPDQNRFESAHSMALDAAVKVDSMIHYAFYKHDPPSWKKAPFDDAHEDMWSFFSKASGMSLHEWARVAQKADYKAAATAAKSAALIGVYTSAHDTASKAAVRAASRMHKKS